VTWMLQEEFAKKTALYTWVTCPSCSRKHKVTDGEYCCKGLSRKVSPNDKTETKRVLISTLSRGTGNTGKSTNHVPKED